MHEITLDSSMVDVAWQLQAQQNEQVLDHTNLPQLMKRGSSSVPQLDLLKRQLHGLGVDTTSFGLQGGTDLDDEDEYEDSPMDRMMKEGARKNAGLPEDLRLTMKRRKNDIVKAATAWVQDGGTWRSNVTAVLPQYSNE